ncbi:ORC ubiquitin ligase 1 [Oncorhynchus mykiss]|uniref:RING-type domain-containing protein n=1 Tax=Oncorhynchus mykiss TaxID=8022 RepID=A0A8K9WXV2_ONCMY|nr:ORC ubiquitin ligase 1 [Oncorhynchus mykiss]
MANNFQNVTISLTLPISCQICLGKVRHPVICANNHVFCSGCMDIWLKKASQCPSCRVPITSENPCREIIGGTNESESNESYSVKKHLRKTRAELLLREYEDEVEGLLKENEELRNKNQILESQLKTVLDPCTVTASRREDRGLDPGVVEEWSNKLRAATDGYRRIKLDVEKLKGANKMLRCQTIDLVQENVRLKAEVASRSPQKFGRYTVAALEAKIHQYERDLDHLKKALERSDQYIEELETRGGGVAERLPREAPQGHTDARPESSTSGEGEAGTRVHYQRISATTRSLSDMEKASVCTGLEGESKTLSAHHNYLLTTSNAVELDAIGSDTFRDHRRGFGVTLLGHKDSIDTDRIDAIVPSDLFLLSTPSSAFRSLSLKSPSVGEDKKLGYKAVTHLRRLSFEDSVTPSSSSSVSTVATKRSNHTAQLSNGVSSCNAAEPGLSTAAEPLFWAAAWQSRKASDITSVTSVTSPNHNGEEEHRRQLNTSSGSGHGERNQTAGVTTSRALTEDEAFTDEAFMDVAYLDKISELDSMMLEGPESCGSAGSHLSLASSLTSADTPDLTLDLRLDVTLVPEVEGCSELFLDPDSEQDRGGGGQTEAEGFGIKGTSSTPVTVSATRAASLAPTSTTTATGSGSSSGRDDGSGDHSLLDSTGPAREQGHLSDPSQTDELSFDLLFDPLTETRTGPGGPSAWQASANHRHDISSDCCSADRPGGDAVREKSAGTPSQATKRKSRSPFDVGSPSKHHKFM